MAVQHTEAPGGRDQDPGAGKQDAHEPDGKIPLRPLEARRDEIDEHRRGRDAKQHEDSDSQRQHGKEDSGRLRRRLVLAARLAAPNAPG